MSPSKAPVQRERITLTLLDQLPDPVQSIKKTYESLFRAYHALILSNRSKTTKGIPIPLPSVWTQRSTLQLWSTLPVITAFVPVLPLETFVRSEIPRIHDFGSSFQSMATGITNPLRVTCTSSSGEPFVQILKLDEIRSDCVVQQLFELINRLLEEQRTHEEQRAVLQSLHLRTYHVGCLKGV